MQLFIFLLLLQLILIYNNENILYATALIGENISRAGNNEFPALVALLMYNGPSTQVQDNIICTGSLISRDHVLTAEHCLKLLEDAYILFVIGSNDIRTGMQRFSMWWLSYDQWITQFNYQTNFVKNDIIIVRLMKSVPDNINPASLSDKTVPQLVGRHITVAGWGVGNYAGTPSRFLKKGTLTILDTERCVSLGSKIEGRKITITDTWFCSMAKPYVLLDLGDSGGPAFDRYGKILGINLGHCPKYNDQFHPNKSNLHLAVSYYSPFIKFCLEQ